MLKAEYNCRLDMKCAINKKNVLKEFLKQIPQHNFRKIDAGRVTSTLTLRDALLDPCPLICTWLLSPSI